MNTFAYQARNSDGKTIGGIQEALNEENAINTLMSRGLMVLSIQEKAGAKGRVRNKRVSESDLVLFTRQIATMIDAGLPITTALTALYEQADPKRQLGLRNVIGDITARIEQGDSFYEAISKHPKVFTRLYTSMVKAGESGGVLADIMDRLAGFLEASARLRKKIKSAMTYPVIVISISMLITLFLVIKVVPVFAGIFKDFGHALPVPTQLLVDFSDSLRSYWYIIFPAIFGIIFGIRYYLNTKTGSDQWDRLKLKLPIFGPLIHKVSMTRFARTFAQLIRSGVPILEVMDIVGETSGNIVVKESVDGMAKDVEKGDHLSASMARHKIFPPMLIRMISAGESTGKMDTMLDKMADFWDEEIEATLNSLTSLIEPILICVLGVIVGGIVIALYLPIFKMGDVVSGMKG